MLAAFGLRGRRNLVAACNSPGNRFGQAVRGLHQRICKVVSSGERLRKIRKPHVEPLYRYPRAEACRIARGEHQMSSFRMPSCLHLSASKPRAELLVMSEAEKSTVLL